MTRLLLVLLALLVFPAFAQAGCQARGGAVADHSGYESANAYMDCTTNNGPSYEIRAYMQGDYGGWHAVNPAIRFTVTPVTNGTVSRYYAVQCAYFAAGDSQVRSKVVVENLSTGSTDVAYGPIKGLPSACQ